MVSNNNKPLGELLVEINLITREQLEEALREQETQKDGRALAEILLDLG